MVLDLLQCKRMPIKAVQLEFSCRMRIATLLETIGLLVPAARGNTQATSSKVKGAKAAVKPPPCPRCKEDMQESTTVGDPRSYTRYSCDGSCGRSKTGLRWHCKRCRTDYCFQCKPKAGTDEPLVFAVGKKVSVDCFQDGNFSNAEIVQDHGDGTFTVKMLLGTLTGCTIETSTVCVQCADARATLNSF